MKLIDAAKILGLDGMINPEMVAIAYRKMAMQFHPDRNPAGLEMMQAINEAREALREYKGSIESGHTGPKDYADILSDAINAIIYCDGLDIEICGSWVWVSGDTKPHKEILKGAGYRWASKKKMWYYRPSDWKSHSFGNFSMTEIREIHGSDRISTVSRPSIKMAA